MSEEKIEEKTEEIIEEIKEEEDFIKAIEDMEKDYGKPLRIEEQMEFNKKVIGMLRSMGQEIENLIIVLQNIGAMETIKVMGKLLKSFTDATEKGEQLSIKEESESKGTVIYS